MIARRVELDVQSRGRCVLDARASRGGGGPVLSAAAVCRSLRGPLAQQTLNSMALESLTVTVFFNLCMGLPLHRS